MEIVWTDKALDSLKENLEFWDIHNETPSYSDKILAEINKLTSELSDNPLYLGRYNKELNLYVRPILKSRFLLYFELKNKEGKDCIEIQFFKSSKQKPIF